MGQLATKTKSHVCSPSSSSSKQITAAWNAMGGAEGRGSAPLVAGAAAPPCGMGSSAPDADTNSRLGMVYIHKTFLVYYRDLWTCMHALYDRGDFISVCCKSSALAYISRLFDGNISLSILIWFITYKVLAPSWTVSYFALSQVKVI